MDDATLSGGAPSADAHSTARGPQTVKVWDPLVRILHWTLAVGIAAAWATAEESARLHEAVGLGLLAAIALRSLWGLVGPRHARFAGFVPGPGGFLAYLGDLLSGRARRHLGHNPAGGAMIVALLTGLLVTIATGIGMAYGLPGLPLRGEALEEIHEAAAAGTLVLIVLHVGGVILSSLLHRENLILAMVTGRKRAS
jgi:cytochrome b